MALNYVGVRVQEAFFSLFEIRLCVRGVVAAAVVVVVVVVLVVDLVLVIVFVVVVVVAVVLVCVSVFFVYCLSGYLLFIRASIHGRSALSPSRIYNASSTRGRMPFCSSPCFSFSLY